MSKHLNRPSGRTRRARRAKQLAAAKRTPIMTPTCPPVDTDGAYTQDIVENPRWPSVLAWVFFTALFVSIVAFAISAVRHGILEGWLVIAACAVFVAAAAIHKAR